MIIKFFKHLKTVLKHKFYVGYYCFLFGIPIQGILHDLSKFSPVEFFESVKYYQGTSSPIDACKKANGWSKAWMHHKGRNKHHYEYWMDNFDNGGTPLLMPFKYALEMLCDYLGAGRAYMGKKFTYKDEYNWWVNKSSKPIAMHPDILQFIDDALHYLADRESEDPYVFKITKYDVQFILFRYHIIVYPTEHSVFRMSESMKALKKARKICKGKGANIVK